MTMCVHAGGNYVSPAEVLAVQPPPATRSWDPMPHSEVIELVRNELPQFGLQVVDWKHALRTRKETPGSQYFGLVSVRDIENRGAVFSKLRLF